MTFNDNENDFQSIVNKITPRIAGIVFLVIILAIALWTSFFIVDQKEQAVILQFGQYNRTVGEGLHVKLPFGMEKAYFVPTKRNLIEEFGFRNEGPGIESKYSTEDFTKESYMLTGDLNIAEVTWSIQYQIRDPKAWLFNTEDQQKTIRDISRAVINALAGDLSVSDVVTQERNRIMVEGKAMMNKFYEKYGLGAEVVELNLQRAMYPKGEVQDAYEDVNKATQDYVRSINEGKEAYNKEIPRARGVAQQAIREAEGYAVERVNIAKGDVARFLAVFGEYKKNPQVIRMRLYYEMFEEVFGKSESIDLIDKQLKNFIPFKSLSQPSTSTKKGDEK